MIKLLGGHLPIGEIIVLRGIVSVLLLFAACWWYGALTWPKGALLRPPFFLLLLGQVGSTYSFIASLMHLELADANGIQQFQPLALTAASALFLGEQVGWRRWLAALAGLIGVLLIIKPGTSAFEPFALLAATCVLFVVMRDLGNRAMAPGVPSLLLALASASAATVLGAVLSSTETWVQPRPLDWLALCIAAVLVVSGYFCVTVAVRIGELSVVSPFRYASVIMALVLQIAIWGVMPDQWALLGTAIVVGAGLYTFHREQVRRRE